MLDFFDRLRKALLRAFLLKVKINIYMTQHILRAI